MRRRHYEVAGLAAGELVGDAAQVLRVDQDAVDHLHQFLARLGQAEQALAATDEDFDPQFVFKGPDVLADARLRGVERVRHLGQIEVLTHGFAHDAQLLEVHAPALHARIPEPRRHQAHLLAIGQMQFLRPLG